MMQLSWGSSRSMLTLSEDVDTLLLRRRVAEAVNGLQVCGEREVGKRGKVSSTTILGLTYPLLLLRRLWGW